MKVGWSWCWPPSFAALRPMIDSGGQAHRPRCSDEALGGSRGSSAFAYLVALQSSRRRVWAPAQPLSAVRHGSAHQRPSLAEMTYRPQPRRDNTLRHAWATARTRPDAPSAAKPWRRGGTGACCGAKKLGSKKRLSGTPVPQSGRRAMAPARRLRRLARCANESLGERAQSSRQSERGCAMPRNQLRTRWSHMGQARAGDAGGTGECSRVCQAAGPQDQGRPSSAGSNTLTAR